MSCLFCKIAAGEIPATLVHQGEHVVAFNDIDPQAPTHVLVVTREHHNNIADLTQADPALAVELLQVAAAIGTSHANGFRVVLNSGTDGGQSVNHVHAHVLAGRGLTWPPG